MDRLARSGAAEPPLLQNTTVLCPLISTRRSRCRLTDEKATVALPLDPKVLDASTRIVNHHEAVRKAVDLYAWARARHLQDDELAVDLWILVVPEFVYERCRPGSKRTGLPIERTTSTNRKGNGPICRSWPPSRTRAPRTSSTTSPTFTGR